MGTAYPVKRVCEALSISRSSYYYEPKPRDESELKKAVLKLARRFVTYGSRRITQQLKRENWQVGRDRIRRLMRELDIQVRIKRKKIQTTQSDKAASGAENLVQDIEFTRPDQVWASDITFIRLISGVFIYLAVIMDIFTRKIRGWHLSRCIDQELTETALRKAFARGKKPEIHHSDRGKQYTAGAYGRLLDDADAQISLADPGKPTQNAYAERLIKTIKEEEVDLNEYEDFDDAFRQIGQFVECIYNQDRIHSSLGYLTPDEFEKKWIIEHQDGKISTKNEEFCVQI